jgi:serine phosphatase RsbU (regulator of sigma subunit)
MVLPASGYDVGGDFVMALPGPDGDTFLALGDACGSGSAAAGTSAVVQAVLRAVAPTASGPAELLAAVHRAVRPLGALVSALCLRVSSNGHQVEIALAGHPQPMLARNGEVVAVGSPGTLLGVDRDAVDVGTGQVALRPGDALLLFTDGLVERRTATTVEDATDDVRAALAAAGDESAAAVVRRVLTMVVGGEDVRGGDDVAVVALRLARS